MNVIKPTIHVSNPELILSIEGESFASLILHQSYHLQNLLCAVEAMSVINGDQDERLTELQIILQAMTNSASSVLVEQVRLAKSQGLVFDITSGQANVTH